MRVFDPESRPEGGWRARVYSIIFDTDTPAGLLFDILLLVAIVLSIVAISLETVTFFEARHRRALRVFEWVLTGLFTIEYILRLIVVHKPKRYALSFMGLVDLLSLLPTYLSLAVANTHTLQIVRAFRLFRVFRVFQFGQMTTEGGDLWRALVASRHKIAVFLGTVLIIVVIQGAMLYYVEHEVEGSGFTSIPRSVYWAIVTLTTVGYGDISPETVPGQFIASILMLLGYGIIAVPTGIVTAEVALSEISKRTRALESGLDSRAESGPGSHPQPKPSACADGLPAAVVVHGARDAGVTTLSEGVRVIREPERSPEPSPERPPAPEPRGDPGEEGS